MRSLLFTCEIMMILQVKSWKRRTEAMPSQSGMSMSMSRRSMWRAMSSAVVMFAALGSEATTVPSS